MKSEWFIYGLVDPRNDEIRYIGQTVNPKGRLSVHLHAARHGEHTYRSRWIGGLLELNLKPSLTILEEAISTDKIDEREIWWITEAKARGWRLTNMTEGGDGG